MRRSCSVGSWKPIQTKSPFSRAHAGALAELDLGDPAAAAIGVSGDDPTHERPPLRSLYRILRVNGRRLRHQPSSVNTCSPAPCTAAWRPSALSARWCPKLASGRLVAGRMVRASRQNSVTLEQVDEPAARTLGTVRARRTDEQPPPVARERHRLAKIAGGKIRRNEHFVEHEAVAGAFVDVHRVTAADREPVPVAREREIGREPPHRLRRLEDLDEARLGTIQGVHAERPGLARPRPYRRPPPARRRAPAPPTWPNPTRPTSSGTGRMVAMRSQVPARRSNNSACPHSRPPPASTRQP